MLHTATFVVISLFTSSKSCNYVRDPSWEIEYCDPDSGNCTSWSDGREGSIPLGYCQTSANETEDYSGMFLCTPWGQLWQFSWNSTTCSGEPSAIFEVTSNSGYECFSTDTCTIFNVRSNTLDDDDNCVENTEVYDEIVYVADECFVERDENDDGTVSWRSIKPVCTSEESVSYQVYPDVIDCSGDYSEELSVIADDGTCAMTPGGEDGYEMRYISVLNCKEITPQDASVYADEIDAAECSYVANAEFTYPYEYPCWDSDNSDWTSCVGYDTDTYDVSTPMAGNLDAADICVKRYENGKYYSQLVFCADVIQMAFIATWGGEETISRCQGPPLGSPIPIEGYTAMACNNIAGPCPSMLLRISEFEEPDGTGECGYNQNEWNEIRVTLDKCWQVDDGTFVEGTCEVNSDVPSGSYNIFFGNNGTCAGDPTLAIPLADGGCYDFEGEPPSPQSNAAGNYSNIQILSCKDEYLAASEVIPDCKYVESPSYEEETGEICFDSETNEFESCKETVNYYEGFKVPIGECITNMRSDQAYSRIFICTPWNQVVAFEFFGNSCDDFDALTQEPSIVDGFNNNCASDNYCRDTDMYMKVLSNPTGPDCDRNETDYDMNTFVPGCTNKDPVLGTGSTYVMCDGDVNTVDYIVYDRPGCQGNQLLNVDLDTDSTSTGDGDDNCDTFGDQLQFVELYECGAQDPEPITECSYIINPTWEQDEGGSRSRDGAIPLSTDLCMVEVEGNVSVRSYTFWCDPDVNQAFISWWNDTAGCTGYPDDVEIVTSSVEGGMQCTGDNGANCDFGFVTTSTIESTDEDDCMLGADIEQSARLTDVCWYSSNDDDYSGTWMPTTTSMGSTSMSSTSMSSTSMSSTSMSSTSMSSTSMGSTSMDMSGYTSWIVDCGVNAITGEYELEIRMYEGMDCGESGGELLNQLYIDDNECVGEFNDPGTQTYFDIAWCTKTDPIGGRPTEEPLPSTSVEIVSFCEAVNQVGFGADGDYRDGIDDIFPDLFQAKCEYCVCEGTDGDGFNPVCKAVALFVASPICDIFIDDCTEAKQALADYVECGSYDEVKVKSDNDGFVCGKEGFYCDTGTNTGDANTFKVSIISLLSVFIFVIY